MHQTAIDTAAVVITLCLTTFEDKALGGKSSVPLGPRCDIFAVFVGWCNFIGTLWTWMFNQNEA